MALETATYISGLNSSNPVGATDPKSQGDDHLRLIKSTLLNTFPNITGAMTASHTELNNLDGVTGKTGTGNLVLSASPTLTGTLTAAAITASGTLTAAAITASGTITGNLFSGSGASLTSLNASSLASGEVADARLSSNVPLIDAANVFTNIQTVSIAVPRYRWSDTDGTSGAKNWEQRANGTQAIGLVLTDALTNGEVWYTVTANASSEITSIAFTGDDITMTGTVGITGALTATSYGGITEANLVDKSATETISGAWTFSDDIAMSGTRAVDATTRLNLTGATVSVGESGGNLGFFGSAGGVKPTVVGNTGNVTGMVTSLLGALEGLGLITDDTT